MSVDTTFDEELSQLVRFHIDRGDDLWDIADSLGQQLEVVHSQLDEPPPEPIDLDVVDGTPVV